MNSTKRSESQSGVTYQQLSMLHPRITGCPKVSVTEWLDNISAADGATIATPALMNRLPPAIYSTHRQPLRANLVSAIPANHLHSSRTDYLAPPTALALFAQERPLPQGAGWLNPSLASGRWAPPHFTPYSTTWGQEVGLEDYVRIPGPTFDPVDTPFNLPKQRSLTGSCTRILRVLGLVEKVNPEYLEWYLRQHFMFQLEAIIDNSIDSVSGDIEIRFKTSTEQAQKAYELLNNPEFSENLDESILVQFLPEL